MIWSHYLLFLLKTITFVLALLSSIAGLIALINKEKLEQKPFKINLTPLHTHYQTVQWQLNKQLMHKKEFQKQRKTAKKINKQKNQFQKRIFILDFQGDIKASATKQLRHEITALLTVANKKDEVVIRLESAGGLVPHYGLAASQLQRIRQREIPLTIIVDKCAASGGYLMACVADKIIAAPFAVVGSIGVLSQLPNFHRFLQKKNVDIEQLTAGKYKRTLTVLGENTQAARQKAQQELEQLHDLFKAFISQYRPQLNIETVATGEYWYGKQAQTLQLIDSIMTSDDYLLQASINQCALYNIRCAAKKTWLEKITHTTTHLVDTCLHTLTHRNSLI